MTKSTAQQLIGEIVLFTPIILIAWVAGILWPVLSSMVTFFICKWCYQKEPHTHLHISNQACVTSSYTAFIAIGIVSEGVASIIPHMANQPLIPIYLSIAMTLAWAVLGDITAKPPFKCATATAQQLRERCQALGKSKRYTDIIVAAYKKEGDLTQKEIAAQYNLAPKTVREYKRLWTKELEQ